MKKEAKSAKKDRKPYARPKLLKHGKVESMTLNRLPSTSQPV